MTVANYARAFVVLVGAFCLVRCDGEDSAKRKPLLKPLQSGPALLNVSGAGYEIGDIVRIEIEFDRIIKGDVVLFEWKKARNVHGFGPTYAIGEIVGTPGDEFDMASFRPYHDREGKEKSVWLQTFEIEQVQHLEGTFKLGSDDFLVETASHVMWIKGSLIGAIVVERIGHDDEAEEGLRKIVY